MRDYQGKKKWHIFFRSKSFILLVLVIFIFLGRGVWDVYKKDEVARMNKDEALLKLNALKSKEEGLTAEIERLKSERGIEEELRRRFQVAKPGEEILVVIDKNQAKKELVSEREPWYESVWNEILAAIGIK